MRTEEGTDEYVYLRRPGRREFLKKVISEFSYQF